MSGCVSSTAQPRFSKTFRCGSSAAVTRRSIGRPPRSRLQATRTPRTSRASGRRKPSPGSAIAIGERASGPAMALSISAASATVRAIGPCTLSVDHASSRGHTGTRPGEVRKPTILQNAAGLRSEPPVSLPSAIGTMPHASSTEHLVERLRAGAELRRVRLAHGDGTRGAQPLDDQPVDGGDVIAIDRRPPRRADAPGRDEILVRDRQPEQRARPFAARESRVLVPGVVERALGRERDDCVDLRVDALDLCEMRAHDFGDGDVAPADAFRQLDRGQKTEITHGARRYARPDVEVNHRSNRGRSRRCCPFGRRVGARVRRSSFERQGS